MTKELEDIKAIREMMERSSKFISLSGISGIIAGVTALTASLFAYFYLIPSVTDGVFHINEYAPVDLTSKRDVLTIYLVLIAVLVLIVSLSCGLYFSWRKSKKLNLPLVNSVSLRALYNMGMPLFVGGVLCLLFILRNEIVMTIPVTLLFYGMALFSTSKYTYDEIHYLGITEIILGLTAAIMIMLFEIYYPTVLIWALGFGVCHIIYGAAMYIKYDLKK